MRRKQFRFFRKKWQSRGVQATTVAQPNSERVSERMNRNVRMNFCSQNFVERKILEHKNRKDAAAWALKGGKERKKKNRAQEKGTTGKRLF